MKTIEVVFVCDPPSVTSQSLVEDFTSSTIPPASFQVCHRAQVVLPSVLRGTSSLNCNCVSSTPTWENFLTASVRDRSIREYKEIIASLL